jgi:hypothetical protein
MAINLKDIVASAKQTFAKIAQSPMAQAAVKTVTNLPQTFSNPVGSPVVQQAFQNISNWRPNPQNSMTLGQGISKLPEQVKTDWLQGGLVKNNPLLGMVNIAGYHPSEQAMSNLAALPGSIFNTYARAVSVPFRPGPLSSKIGDIAAGVGSIMDPIQGPIGGAFGAGMKGIDNLTKGQPFTQDMGEAYTEGTQFGYTLTPLSKITGTILEPLVSKFAPVEIQNINQYLNLAKTAGSEGIRNQYLKLAAKRIIQNLTKDSLEGAVSMGLFGATMPASNKEERIKNILDQGIMGAKFAAGMGGIKLGVQAGVGQLPGLIKNTKSEDMPLGLSVKKLTREQHYQNLAEQQGTADLGGGKSVVTQPLGEMNIEKPVLKAVDATFDEGTGSSGFHRNLDKVSNIKPSWAIIYKTKPSPELISAAEEAGLKVNVRKNGITDVYAEDISRTQTQKAQNIFDKFAEIYKTKKAMSVAEPVDIKGKTAPVQTEVTPPSPETQTIAQDITAGTNKAQQIQDLMTENQRLLADRAPGESMTDYFKRNVDAEAKIKANKEAINNLIQGKDSGLINAEDLLNTDTSKLPDRVGGLNVKRLKLSESGKKVIAGIQPELEKIKGRTLTHKEIIDASEKAPLLERVVTRAETKAVDASLLATKAHISNLDRSVEQALKEGKNPKAYILDMLETSKKVSAYNSDVARRLEANKVNPEELSTRARILSDLGKIEADSNKLAEEAAKVDWNDSKSIQQFYRQFVKPGLREIIDEMRYNNILSNPKSQLRNIFGNLTQTFVVRPATDILSETLKGTTSGLKGQGFDLSRGLKAGAQYYKGSLGAFPEASKALMNAIKGKTPVEKLDINFMPTGVLPEKWNLPSNLMEGMDRFFTTLIMGGEMAQGKSASSAETLAKYSLFRNKLDPSNNSGQGILLSKLDKLGVGINQMRNWLPGGKWMVPFFNTGFQIAKQWIEYSPAGLATIPGAADKEEQLAKALIGSGLFMFGTALANSGNVTWAAPTDPKEKELFYATGRKPYSIKIGENWVPMNYLGTISLPFAVPAAMHYWNKEAPTAMTDSTLQKVGKTMLSGVQLWAQQTSMANVENILKMLQGDIDTSLAGSAGFATAQIIPMEGFLRYVAQFIDPVYRKAGGFLGNIEAGLPLVSMTLPSYKDPLGNTEKRSFINNFLPYDISKSNINYEIPYQMRMSQLQSNAIENNIQKQAETFIEQMHGVPQDVALTQLTDMQKNNPKMFQNVKDLLQKQGEVQKAGLQGLYTTQPGQEPGRALYIINKAKELKDPEKISTFLDNLQKLQVLTPKVIVEIQKQLEQGKAPTNYGVNPLEKIKYLLGVPEAKAADIGTTPTVNSTATPAPTTQQTPTTKSSTIPPASMQKIMNTLSLTSSKKKVKIPQKLITAAGRVPKAPKSRKFSPKNTSRSGSLKAGSIKAPKIKSATGKGNFSLKSLNIKFPKFYMPRPRRSKIKVR